jgi:hypothetical protein
MNPVSVKSSRLQRFLSEMAVADGELNHKNFADKLSQLIDLSDSISLAESLRGLKKLPVRPVDGASRDIKSEFLQLRSDILSFILNSFISEDEEASVETSSPFILPRPNRDTLDDPEAGFQTYQRFYNLHQSEMAHRLLTMRQRLRQELAGQSQALAQLAELDRSLSDTLADYTARVFASIPRLLARRFFYLNKQYRAERDAQFEVAAESTMTLDLVSKADLNSPQQWLRKGAWLDNFINEMQGLLLAELDLRLMPLIGLMEALDVEVVKP